jgi:hypothetical protein
MFTMTTMTTDTQPDPQHSTTAKLAPQSLHLSLPIDIVAALPARLRIGGFDETAAIVEERIDVGLGRDERLAYIEAARDIYAHEGETEIDDNAIVSDSEDGAYVMAWCWVYKCDAGLEEPNEDEAAEACEAEPQ